MIKITFVCYGNICRSPMAEYIFKDLLKEKGEEKNFIVDSAATSAEEIGNPIYPPAKKILNRMGINCDNKRARQLQKSDYVESDFFIVMDDRNVQDCKKIFGGDPQNKVKKIMSFVGESCDVADPWWTRDFEKTFCDLVRGLNGLYTYLKNSNDNIL